MASGHVNRTNRPNTWLHRPACGREESPCQLGAVHTWHESEMPRRVLFGRLRGQSGHGAERHRLVWWQCRSDERCEFKLEAGAATPSIW